MNFSLSDIKLPDYLTNVDKHILIFDDLERCKLELNNILGYINYFVEHQGHKVIILAHEDKLTKIDTSEDNQSDKAINNESYKEIKEKLIGKTLLIVPDLDSAINDFIDKVSNAETKEFLSGNSILVKET